MTFAEIESISRQAAHRAVARTLSDPAYLYRGSRLIVRRVKGKGGKSGRSFEVAAESLPVASQLVLTGPQRHLERTLRHDAEADKERDWWSFNLASIAAFKKNSAERGRAITDFAALTHLDWTGNPCTFNARTVRRKLDALENRGLAGITPQVRMDVGMKRVIVTREVDSAARATGISKQQLEDMRTAIQQYIQKQIAAGAPRKIVNFNATFKLNDLAQALGIGTDSIRFTLPDHLIQAERQFKNRARYDRDRKAHEDANPRGMWDAIGVHLEKSVSRHFERGVGPDNSVWPKSLRAIVEGGQTLVNTGHLADTITHNATDHGVEVGSNLAYAAIHQFGGTIHHSARRQVLQFRAHKKTGKILPGFRKLSKANVLKTVDVGAYDVTIPARPFLGLDGENEAEITSIIGDWVTSAAKSL